MPNYNPSAPIALTGPPPLSKEAVRAALAAGGANGMRSGAGTPSAGLGNDGDFYIDTTAWTIYGPKTAGAWGSATSLIGPSGAAGPHDGTQNEYGYNTAAGCGCVCTRFGLIGSLIASGQAQWSYFRAPKSFTANTVKFGLTIVGAVTATLSRFGIYAVDASTGALTSLLGSTANDTTLFTTGASSAVPKTKALQAGVPLTLDTWYAMMVLTVQTSTAPQLGFISQGAGGASNMAYTTLPRLNGTLSGLSDLPASVSAGSITGANLTLWTELS